MSVRKWPVVGVLLAGLWLAVRGVALTPQRVLAEGLIGLVVGLVLAYGLRRMYRDEVALGRNLRALPTATYFLVIFVWEVLTANVDVAYRVLHPSMPIEPDVVQVPLRVETDAAITTIANSITLTPGTLTMDHDAETNTLYVHGIVGRRREQVLAPIRRWEDLLLVVFGEDADPDDPPPEDPTASAPETPGVHDEAPDRTGDEAAEATGDEATGDEAAGDEAAGEGGDRDGD